MTEPGCTVHGVYAAVLTVRLKSSQVLPSVSHNPVETDRVHDVFSRVVPGAYPRVVDPFPIHDSLSIDISLMSAPETLATQRDGSREAVTRGGGCRVSHPRRVTPPRRVGGGGRGGPAATTGARPGRPLRPRTRRHATIGAGVWIGGDCTEARDPALAPAIAGRAITIK